jgi:rubrerythrin
MARRKTPSHPHFCKLLNEAIKDETSAPPMYMKLKKKARCSCVKGKFQSIINDERRHKKALVKMRNQFCK